MGLVNATRAEKVDAQEIAATIVRDIASLKWNLWHGNVRRAQNRVIYLGFGVEALETCSDNKAKLSRMLDEFASYISANRFFIPNYGDRWRNGETSQRRSWSPPSIRSSVGGS